MIPLRQFRCLSRTEIPLSLFEQEGEEHEAHGLANLIQQPGGPFLSMGRSAILNMEIRFGDTALCFAWELVIVDKSAHPEAPRQDPWNR